ncbi:T9SS type A sorting domain-containing protein [Puia sp.]|uniref:T9SS type A sorting domain-containing protein n=1 Tax=Puia sp. TaxID=2045100 RepID=UPI002F404636
MKTILPAGPVLRRFAGALLIILFFRNYTHAQATAMLKWGNSYINLSKKTVGGPVEPGDSLEIRVNFYVNQSYRNSGKMYKVRYYDSVPSNTIMKGTDSLMLISNEGLIMRHYSQTSDSDPGTYNPSPAYAGGYQIRINLGTGSSAPAGIMPMATSNSNGAGTITGNTTLPRFSQGTLTTTAFRVLVTGAYGDTITLGGGVIAYRTSSTTFVDSFLYATPYKILIQKPSTLCANGSSTNFAAESGGTFGIGVGRNRSAPPSYLIPGYTYLPTSNTSTTINDGFYAIVNNVSPTSSTVPGANRKPSCGSPPAGSPLACANREFGGFWYIAGDHTGTTTAAGNAPPDDNTNAGYMLLVNADLATSEAYHQVIAGLCPNTYYQFSAWFKNVCPNCGIDTAGVAEYTPGVLPNLTLVVDGLDRMSTGQLDTVGWQQRGFVLLTGPNQNSITISIRNNASGGGGNDWALDDITLATCPPDLLLTPDRPDTLCQGADDSIKFRISSYVGNYTQWKMEQSNDNGATWVTPPLDTLGRAAHGTVIPVYNMMTGQYVDTVTRFYRISATNSVTIYRLIVASTDSNLNTTGCFFTTNQPKFVFGVNCMTVLPTTILSFNGKVKDGLGNLQWTTSNEVSNLAYAVMRSDDGVHFTTLVTLPAAGGDGGGAAYTFSDPKPVGPQTYYRIDMIVLSARRNSGLVLLSNSNLSFEVRSVQNPFTDHLNMELTAPANGVATISLVDMYGRYLRRVRQSLTQGLNSFTVYDLGSLPPGAYALQIQFNDQLVSQKLVKVKNLVNQ